MINLSKGTLKKVSYQIYKYIVNGNEPISIEDIYEEFEKYPDKYIHDALDNLLEVGYILYPKENYIQRDIRCKMVTS